MANLSAQQRAVLLALIDQSPLPTTILRDVRVRYEDAFPTRTYLHHRPPYPIGEPVFAVLRRLEKRGFVTSEMGRDCKDWWISDAGLTAMGWSR